MVPVISPSILDVLEKFQRPRFLPVAAAECSTAWSQRHSLQSGSRQPCLHSAQAVFFVSGLAENGIKLMEVVNGVEDL